MPGRCKGESIYQRFIWQRLIDRSSEAEVEDEYLSDYNDTQQNIQEESRAEVSVKLAFVKKVIVWKNLMYIQGN